MKIAFYVQRVASAPGFRNNISAHVQLPVKTMLLLRERGHDVELITKLRSAFGKKAGPTARATAWKRMGAPMCMAPCSRLANASGLTRADLCYTRSDLRLSQRSFR